MQEATVSIYRSLIAVALVGISGGYQPRFVVMFICIGKKIGRARVRVGSYSLNDLRWATATVSCPNVRAM